MRRTSAFGLSARTGVSRKSINGARLNCTATLGRPARQPLAGSQIERDARPSPVVDEEPHRDERFGARLRIDVRFLRVAVVLRRARRGARTSSSGERRHRVQHPHLLVAHVLGRRTRSAAPSRRASAPGTCGSARCRAARRPCRSTRRACRRRRLRRRSSARDRRSAGSRSARRCRWRIGTPGCSGRSPFRGSDRCGRSAIPGVPSTAPRSARGRFRGRSRTASR